MHENHKKAEISRETLEYNRQWVKKQEEIHKDHSGYFWGMTIAAFVILALFLYGIISGWKSGQGVYCGDDWTIETGRNTLTVAVPYGPGEGKSWYLTDWTDGVELADTEYQHESAECILTIEAQKEGRNRAMLNYGETFDLVFEEPKQRLLSFRVDDNGNISNVSLIKK